MSSRLNASLPSTAFQGQAWTYPITDLYGMTNLPLYQTLYQVEYDIRLNTIVPDGWTTEADTNIRAFRCGLQVLGRST